MMICTMITLSQTT